MTTGADAAPEPTAFTAETRNQYAVPFVRFEMVVLVPTTPDATTIQFSPSSERSTLYVEIGLPPSEAGAFQVSNAAPSPGIGVIDATVPGIVAGVDDALADAALAPTAFRADTRNT